MAVDININLNGSTSDSEEKTSDLNQATKPASTNPKAKDKSAKKSQSMALVTLLAKSTVNYATQNVGKWTGNTTLQNNISNIKTAAAFGLAAIKHPVLSIGIAGVQLGTTALNNWLEDKENAVTARRQQARAGYFNNKVPGRRY